jgi:hypothetical protein
MFIRKKDLIEETHFGQIHHYVLNSQSTFGLILFHIVYSITNTNFFLFISVFLSTISYYLYWVCKVLTYVLDEIPYFTFSCLLHEYFITIKNKIVEI